MFREYEELRQAQSGFSSLFRVGGSDAEMETGTGRSGGETAELPAAASATDAREVVRILNCENSFIRNYELPTVKPSRIFEPRKLEAYEIWGLIDRDENCIRLSGLGNELVQSHIIEKRIYRKILRKLPPYFAAVKWMLERELKILTFHDLARFWKDEFPELLLDEKTSREIEISAFSFFSICHFAELGLLTIGKRGQPTRLSINQSELKCFLDDDDGFDSNSGNPICSQALPKQKNRRIYISQNGEKPTDHLPDLLELAGFSTIMTGNIELENDLFNSVQLSRMQKCSYGLFILGESDCQGGKGAKRELAGEKIIEINAALALFNDRNIFLWNSKKDPPPVLDESRLRIFTKNGSEWETGLRITRAFKELEETQNLF
ncbi:MAG: hypothetical protein R2747_23865 [Pyrinomonadaceae bacterium]